MPSKLHKILSRFPDDIIERIDAHLERMHKTTPGVDLSRVDAVRMLVTVGLSIEEMRDAVEKKGKK